MNKGSFRYEFHVVHSNPIYPDMPRLFFVKYDARHNLVLLAYEIDEPAKTLLNSHFDPEEAEFWGEIEEFAGPESLTIRNVEGLPEEAIFFPEIVWALETIVSHPFAVSRSENRINVMRSISPEKYRKNPIWLAAETQHMINKRDGLVDKRQAKNRSYDEYTREDSPEESLKKNRKKR